ncbi:MAG: hypothetical protein ACON5B_15470 [Myxococcota bacterium]
MKGFGTDGIRGRSGRTPIDMEGARRIGGACARWAKEVGTGRVLVLRDTRRSGPTLGACALGAVTFSGGIAMDGGVAPTAALMNALELGFADVGLMITASHNPATDNGFKVMGPGGQKIDAPTAKMLERYMGEGPQAGEGGIHREVSRDIREAYASVFADRVGDLAAMAGRHLVLDLAHGAGTTSLDWIREALLPHTTLTVLGAGEGTINDGVGSEYPERLAQEVRALRADAGLAVDGDADRCVLVDDTGAIVHGDALAWWLARACRAECLAVTVMSNQAVEASLPGVEVIRTKVGDKYLAEAMRSQGASLGVEASGHALFKDGLVGGDGLFTGLRALSAAWAHHASLSEALTPFTPFPSRLEALEVRERPPLESIASLHALVEAAPARLGGGRLFPRYSGTQDVLRLLVEGPDAAAVDAVMDEAMAAVREALG